MANNHMKMSIIKHQEMQIKMKLLHTYLKKVTILKAGKGAEKVDHSYTAGVKYKNGTACLENTLAIS